MKSQSSLLNVTKEKEDQQRLQTLQSQREKLVRKREVERRVGDETLILEARESVNHWKEMLKQTQAKGAGLITLEQQLLQAKANHQQSLTYHSTRLANAEANLKDALVGDNKKTKKLTAEIQMLDMEIARTKALLGDSSALDALTEAQLERNKQTLSEIAALTPAPLPPPAETEVAPAAPPPPALSEDEEEAKRLAAKAAAIAEDKEATKAAQNNPIHKIFPGAILVQESKKKKPVKTATSAS